MNSASPDTAPSDAVPSPERIASLTAAVWIRGRESKFLSSPSAASLTETDAKMRESGFAPVDVAGFAASANREPEFFSLWVSAGQRRHRSHHGRSDGGTGARAAQQFPEELTRATLRIIVAPRRPGNSRSSVWNADESEVPLFHWLGEGLLGRPVARTFADLTSNAGTSPETTRNGPGLCRSLGGREGI